MKAFPLLFLLLSLIVIAPVMGDIEDLDLPVTPNKSKNNPNKTPTLAPTPPPPPVVEKPDEPSIFGEKIETEGDTIYFVIDVSGSMCLDTGMFVDINGVTRPGNRLDKAKAELNRCLDSLSPEFRFNILAYDCTTQIWAASLQKATRPNIISAKAWVMRLEYGGGTGTGEACAMALEVKENHTVVLLTDGAPNCYINGASGGAPSPALHRQMIKAANTQGASIHVFGIGAYGEFREFCIGVARDNNGSYTEVR